MSKRTQHFLSMLLTVVLLINLLPVSALAANVDDLDNELSGSTGDLEDVYIIGEVTENRSEFSKEYVLSNGLHMATVYGEPVHYEENGAWKEIDNTLRASGSGANAVYTNTAGAWEVSFPQQLSGNRPVSVTKDGYTLRFTMAGEVHASPNAGLEAASEGLSVEESPFVLQNAEAVSAEIKELDLTEVRAGMEFPEIAPDNLYSRLEYADVYNNTDIVYDLSGSQLKESIVIESHSESLYGYQYMLDTGGMVPVLTDSGEIQLYDATGQEVIMVMPAPYLVDNAGEYCDDVTVELLNVGGSYVLSYLLPQDWLSDEDRQWPVILDPIISTEADFENAQDQTVYENQYITTSPSTGSVTCGYEPNCMAIRFYLQYTNLPDLTSADVIVNASLSLYATAKSGAATIEVHKVTQEWSAGNISWTNQPTFEENAIDYARCTTVERFYNWEITDLVQSWYAGNPNYGMVFKVSNSAEASRLTSWYRFYSSNMDIDCMPVLSIVFRNNNGLEGYWDYTASSAGRAGTGYINNYTGNLVWIHGDIGFGGNRMPVSINHVYNANDSANNTFGMGYGWRTNFNQRVYHWNNPDAATDYYVWEDSDGTSHYFYQDGTDTNKYHDEDGLELTLTRTPSETDGEYTYCITDKYGNTSSFDTAGRLIEQRNNQAIPSSITISYTDDANEADGTDVADTSDESNTTNEPSYLISEITDGAGRVYEFKYNEAGTLLEKIRYQPVDENTEVSFITFGYDGSCRLTSITNQDGKTASYSYEGNTADPTKNLINSATDIDGYKLEYTYTTLAQGLPARVASVAESDGATQGGSLGITYGQNQTTFTDHNGNVQIMQFNSFGNTIAIMDDQGRAQHAQFAFTSTSDIAAPTETNGYAKGNQLRLSSKLQNTVGNVLDDSSFERSVNWTATSGDVTVSVASGTAYYGSKALKLVRSAAGDAAGAYSASFTVEEDASYTFSAYVKTGTGAAYLDITDGTTTVTSQTLAANSDWTRLEVCYTNDGDSAQTVTARIMTAEAGTVYMDCAQVEKCVTASRYNLVENGDFRYTTAWDASTGRTTIDNAIAPELDTNVYQLTGAALQSKRLSQTVYVSGNAEDTFVLAGWAMGDSVPLDTTPNLPREFGLIITFNYTNGTKGSTTVRFNPYVTNWQYAAGVAVAEKAYSSIKVELVYDYNLNDVFFDGIQLYKEKFGSSYTYDENGNVVAVADIQGGTTEYTYDDRQNLTGVELPDNTTLTYTYDDYHNVLTATSEAEVVYHFTYDGYGNNTSVSIVTEGGKITSYAAYNAVPEDVDATTLPEQNPYGNRLVSTTDPAGKVTTYNYHADTNVLEWVQYPEDTAETRTNYTYDTMYRMATSTEMINDNSTLSVAYTYGIENADGTVDDPDLLTKIQTPTTAYTFTYGDFAMRTGINAGSHTLATYTYTNDQNKYLETLAYGNDDSVQYTYDELGRVTVQTYEDGDTVTYKYDNNGALATVTDSATGITTTYYYDLTQRLMKYVESDGTNTHSVGYEYDTINNLTALVETINGVAHTTSYTYDSDNRISSVTNDDTTKSYTYDAYSRVSEQTIANDGGEILSIAYAYRNPSDTTTTGQVSSLTIDADSFGVTYAYTYDDNGNILTVSDGTNTTSYVYDSAGQLLRENNQAAGKTWVWEYDNAGNIQSRTEYAYTTAEDLSGLACTETEYDYATEGWKDLLISYDGQSIEYDEIGNPEKVKDANGNVLRSYTWEHGRELASMTDGTTTWSYTYDANGMRTERSNGTTTYEYVYNGSQLVQMTVGADTLYFTPDTVTLNSTTYYYVKNLQGDITAILNSGGTAVVQYTYDAWGNILSMSDTSGVSLGTLNPLRYRGYVYDQESGLYYLQSRYYDPEVGRFINADALVSTGQGVLGNNMFTYCRNNPICRIDISGTADADCVDNTPLDDEDILKPRQGGGVSQSNDSGGYAGYSYSAPKGGGGVSSSVQVGNTTVTFGHGGNHMGTADISKIETFIANDVVTRPPSPSCTTHVRVDYYGTLLEYGYYTRSDTLINVGTYFFVNAHE